tara:strand:+ start:1176 stop:1589 length:414 start_codon:yes stop_codon:yes gene_type:complete
MSKKKKQEWISFTEKGQRWMICKVCQSDYCKVDEGTAAITCSSCVMKKALALKPMDEFFAKQRVSTGRPAGWHFMNEFVDKDGNVFHKGKEQPDLKGTLPPTKVKPRKKKKKLTADQKLFKKAADWKKRLKLRKGKK